MGYVSKVDIHNFRCLSKLQASFVPGINLLYGDNGTGKSSILEALAFVSRGSGGVPQFRDALGPGGSQWRISAVVSPRAGYAGRIHRVAFADGKKTQWIEGQPASNRELAHSLPLASLTPLNQSVVNDGPTARLRWLDWCMFHVEPSFLAVWRAYRRALKQRNAVLRGSNTDRDALAQWSDLVASKGEALAVLRDQWFPLFFRRYVEELDIFFEDTNWTVEQYRGWEQGRPLQAVLRETLSGDLRAGFSRTGPHKADWNVCRNGIHARRRISRGEEKLCSIALLVALAESMNDAIGEFPVLLLDDIEAELSISTRNTVIDRLGTLGAQCILTAHDRLPELKDDAEAAMFHVEHGPAGAAGARGKIIG